MAAKYKLHFWFEWMADTAFQTMNDAARERFGWGMVAPEKFLLTPETIERIHFVSRWHNNSLNWDYPPDPSLWRQDECDQFNAAVKDLYEMVVRELGDDFEVVNVQAVLVEDPDLDKFLNDPENFIRSE